MITYRKDKIQILIYMEKEIKEVLNKVPEEALLICEGFYLDPATPLGLLVEALELEGTYDLAVPQKWAEANNFPKAIWFYGKDAKHSVLGRPLFFEEMMERFRRKVFVQAVQVWNFDDVGTLS